MSEKECKHKKCIHFSIEPDEKSNGTILGYPSCAKYHDIAEWEKGEKCEDFEIKENDENDE